ncbi:hypothetical protein AB0F13_00495 [Streptomyces sp. NPDC026206]|uniref:hypothetical protein n=1 Tax=Streptomyces sp. NPDC026206 TaxID=3157089 RepID=UPI0033FE488B
MRQRPLGDPGVGRVELFSRILLESPTLTRSYLPMVRERQRLLAELLAARAPGAERAELDLFAALAIAAGETAYAALHTAMAAGEPAERVRAAVDAALERGFSRLARAYPGPAPLTAGPA